MTRCPFSSTAWDESSWGDCSQSATGDNSDFNQVTAAPKRLMSATVRHGIQALHWTLRMKRRNSAFRCPAAAHVQVPCVFSARGPRLPGAEVPRAPRPRGGAAVAPSGRVLQPRAALPLPSHARRHRTFQLFFDLMLDYEQGLKEDSGQWTPHAGYCVHMMTRRGHVFLWLQDRLGSERTICTLPDADIGQTFAEINLKFKRVCYE